MAVIEFLLFVFSSGLFCSQKFRSNIWAVVLAGTIATVSSLLFVVHSIDPAMFSWMPARSNPAEQSPIKSASYSAPAAVKTQQLAYLPPPNPKTIELERWHAASKADTPAAYLDYLYRYPYGDFADVARDRIQALRTEDAHRTSKNAAVAPPTAAVSGEAH